MLNHVISKLQITTQRDTTIYLLEEPTSKTDNTRCYARNSHALLAESTIIQPLWKSLAVSYNTKYPVVAILGIFPSWIYAHKDLHMNMYRSSAHSCQNLEATNMGFNRWIADWHFYTMEYYSVLRRNEQPRQKMKRRNPRCIS